MGWTDEALGEGEIGHYIERQGDRRRGWVRPFGSGDQ